MTKGKQLKDLNLKVGDKVKCVGWADDPHDRFCVGREYTILENHPENVSVGMCAFNENGHQQVYPSYESCMLFEVISRASEDTPKTWGEMTSEEKGALLLAAHEGEVIEIKSGSEVNWTIISQPKFDNPKAKYRVKPKEPEVKVVEMYANKTLKGFGLASGPNTEYKITFNTIDGEPDLGSIKMIKL